MEEHEAAVSMSRKPRGDDNSLERRKARFVSGEDSDLDRQLRDVAAIRQQELVGKGGPCAECGFPAAGSVTTFEGRRKRRRLMCADCMRSRP